MIYIFMLTTPQISRFLGPRVKYRPKFSFSSKKVKFLFLLGFWLIKVGNCYFYIHIKFPDHTVRIFYKIVINNIFRVVITSLLNSIPQWNIGQNSIFNQNIAFLTKIVTNIDFFSTEFLVNNSMKWLFQ